jgi:hypothetical protein
MRSRGSEQRGHRGDRSIHPANGGGGESKPRNSNVSCLTARQEQRHMATVAHAEEVLQRYQCRGGAVTLDAIRLSVHLPRRECYCRAHSLNPASRRGRSRLQALVDNPTFTTRAN